jgi:hypothetical protein
MNYKTTQPTTGSATTKKMYMELGSYIICIQPKMPIKTQEIYYGGQYEKYDFGSQWLNYVT